MMKNLALSALFLTSAMATLSAGPATVQGTYVEARTSEVFAGACVINGEAATAGREALLAWKVDSGQFNGVPLDGLAVVAAVSRRHQPERSRNRRRVATTRTALFVDSRATEAQRKALVAMVKTLSSRVVGTVAEVTPASIEFVAGDHDIRSRPTRCGSRCAKQMSHDATLRKQEVVRSAVDRPPRRNGHRDGERVQRHLPRHEVERPEQALRVLRNVPHPASTETSDGVLQTRVRQE